MIYWRCNICDPERRVPHAVKADGSTSIDAAYQLVLADHERIAPGCFAASGSTRSIAIDFLIRMVQ